MSKRQFITTIFFLLIIIPAGIVLAVNFPLNGRERPETFPRYSKMGYMEIVNNVIIEGMDVHLILLNLKVWKHYTLDVEAFHSDHSKRLLDFYSPKESELHYFWLSWNLPLSESKNACVFLLYENDFLIDFLIFDIKLVYG
jgi:hypothetical protein